MRGRKVGVAPQTRPTQDRVREALFSRWHHRIEGIEGIEGIKGACFLELFCGGGAVAIEGLSRGLETAYLIDASSRSLAVARSNFERLGLECNATRCSLPDGLKTLEREWPAQFDLVFADPPYGFEGLDGLVEAVQGRLKPGGEFALEHSKRDQVQACAGLVLIDQRRYGETMLSFFRRASQVDP